LNADYIFQKLHDGLENLESRGFQPQKHRAHFEIPARYKEIVREYFSMFAEHIYAKSAVVEISDHFRFQNCDVFWVAGRELALLWYDDKDILRREVL